MHPLDAKNAAHRRGLDRSSSSATTTTPIPAAKQRAARRLNDQNKTEFGPYQFITDKVLAKLNDPELRLFGVDHIAVAWLDRDPEWTTEKGINNNNLASNTVPLLDRAAPSAGSEGGGGAAAPGGAVSSNAARQMQGMMGAVSQADEGAGQPGRPDETDDQQDGGRNDGGRNDGGRMMGGMPGSAAAAAAAKKDCSS